MRHKTFIHQPWLALGSSRFEIMFGTCSRSVAPSSVSDTPCCRISDVAPGLRASSSSSRLARK